MKVAVVLLWVLTGPAMAQVAEPESYRTDAYRAPVPATLSGATVVDADQAFALWNTGTAAFIDVSTR